MKRRFISILILVFILAAFLMTAAACSYDEFSYYESFYEDMDISVRLEDYIRSAENGDVSRFYYDELMTFKDDLEFMPDECGTRSEEVNNLFIAAADLLIGCCQQNRIGDADGAKQCLDLAKSCFNDGNMRYNDFVVSDRS